MSSWWQKQRQQLQQLYEQFKSAIKENDVEKIHKIVTEGGDVNVKSLDEYGYTPLHAAAKNGASPAVFDVLITNGADVNITDGYGYTPLRVAVENGASPAVFDVLISNGADVNITNEIKDTLLHMAARKAARKNHVEAIKILLKAGANPLAQNNLGDTPLHIAARCNKKELVETLIKHSDTMIRNEAGQTPSSLAEYCSTDDGYRNAYGDYSTIIDILQSGVVDKDDNVDTGGGDTASYIFSGGDSNRHVTRGGTTSDYGSRSGKRSGRSHSRHYDRGDGGYSNASKRYKGDHTSDETTTNSDITVTHTSTAIHVRDTVLVQGGHIPYLLKSLKPVWAQWEQLGQALGIAQNKLQNIKSSHQLSLPSPQESLFRVIEVFGAMTTFEEHTWRKIHEAVTTLDKLNIAIEIEKDHSYLDEPLPFDTTTKQLVSAPILEAVRDAAHDWMMFGTYLGVPYHKLQEIGRPTNVGTCMLATLNEWISLKPQETTIHNLISAIRGPIIDNESLAQCIEGDPKIKDTFSL